MNTSTESPADLLIEVQTHTARFGETPTLRPHSPLMLDVVELPAWADDIVDTVSIRALNSTRPRFKHQVGNIRW